MRLDTSNSDYCQVSLIMKMKQYVISIQPSNSSIEILFLDN